MIEKEGDWDWARHAQNQGVLRTLIDEAEKAQTKFIKAWLVHDATSLKAGLREGHRRGGEASGEAEADAESFHGTGPARDFQISRAPRQPATLFTGSDAHEFQRNSTKSNAHEIQRNS
jgi:hypothetical protein